MAAVWKTAKRVFRDHKRIPGDENMPTNDELLLLGLSLDTFQIGLDLQIFSREVREAKRARKGNGLFWFVCPLILAACYQVYHRSTVFSHYVYDAIFRNPNNI